MIDHVHDTRVADGITMLSRRVTECREKMRLPGARRRKEGEKRDRSEKEKSGTGRRKEEKSGTGRKAGQWGEKVGEKRGEKRDRSDIDKMGDPGLFFVNATNRADRSWWNGFSCVESRCRAHAVV